MINLIGFIASFLIGFITGAVIMTIAAIIVTRFNK